MITTWSHKPVRVYRRRVRGWRMPAGAVYVGRPTRWGNPYPVVDGDHAAAVAAYRSHLKSRPDLVAAARCELAGRDLACWCPPGRPCHVDVLLEYLSGTWQHRIMEHSPLAGPCEVRFVPELEGTACAEPATRLVSWWYPNRHAHTETHDSRPVCDRHADVFAAIHEVVAA